MNEQYFTSLFEGTISLTKDSPIMKEMIDKAILEMDKVNTLYKIIGASILTSNGDIYSDHNLKHPRTCAETRAFDKMGTDRMDITDVVLVNKGWGSDTAVMPCGNCRWFFYKNAGKEKALNIMFWSFNSDGKLLSNETLRTLYPHANKTIKGY